MLSYLTLFLNNKSVEKNINIQQVLFFSFLKKPGLKKKKKKITNINYFIIVLIKMRLLIFLVFSSKGLACKYGIIFQNRYITGSRIAFFNTGCNNY